MGVFAFRPELFKLLWKVARSPPVPSRVCGNVGRVGLWAPAFWNVHLHSSRSLQDRRGTLVKLSMWPEVDLADCC